MAPLKPFLSLVNWPSLSIAFWIFLVLSFDKASKVIKVGISGMGFSPEW
jgi:hypothetical protein